MKKTFFYSIFVLVGALSMAYTSSVEARHHHRSTHIQVGIDGGAYNHDSYMVRQYTAPAPVIVQPAVQYYAQPGVVYTSIPPTQVITYQTPMMAYPAPMYVEQVYVSRPRINTGLSFSWNFFR
jgi:hypothetical protein